MVKLQYWRINNMTEDCQSLNLNSWMVILAIMETQIKQEILKIFYYLTRQEPIHQTKVLKSITTTID